MLVSLNWLKKYVNINNTFSAEEVAAKLKASTVEVERVDYQGKNLEGIVVGEILEIMKHPHADKLSIAKVEVGEEKPRQIIFGQMVQMQVGFKVPVALAPTILPGGKEIKKTIMRGEISEGMLCLDQEMGLLKEGASIHFFGKEVQNGTPIVEALDLDDYIFEIDNKSLSHRPDLWGHYGIAREVSVLFNRDLNEYEIKAAKEIKKLGNREIKLDVAVEDQELCPRFMGVVISGVKVGESPEWMKRALLAVGLRPINNIVDITNYVMLDLGKPMHVFDKSKVASKNLKDTKLTVRKAKEGERLTALDGKIYDLDNSILVVADMEKPLALAGMIGGEESGVTSNTTDIVFETAIWDAAYIRKTSNKLGLRTDAALRFEKSLDPNLCELSLQKAIELTLEMCPEAKVASKIVDKKHFTLPVGPITIDLATFKKKLGVEIPEKEILRILEKLGFDVRAKRDVLSLKIPTWRATKDVAIAEDVVEEVARIFGYENIPSALPFFSITPPESNKLRLLERKIKNILSSELGYSEVYNYAFVSEMQINKLGDDVSKYIELDNPLSKEKPFLRRNLLPNLLDNLASNIERFPEVKIFEVGKVFTMEETGARVKANSDDLLPHQDVWLTALFGSKKEVAPFWQARRVVENIMTALGVAWKPAPLDKVLPWEHPSRLALFSVHEVVVGTVHELHPETAMRYGLDIRVGVIRINLDKLCEILNKYPVNKVYQALPIYPETERDLAFLVDKKVTHADVESFLQGADKLLEKWELFDVYDGKNIGNGKKSMAYHLIYAHPEHTLTTEEVDKAQAKVARILQQKLNAEIRK